MREELLEKLYDAYDYLHIRNGYVDLISQFERDTQSCRQKYLRIKNEKVSVFHIYLMIFFSAVMLLIFGGLIASQINSPVIVFVIIGAVIVAFVYAGKYAKSKKSEPEKKALEFWDRVGSPTCIENNAKIERLNDEIHKFNVENIHVLEFLPEDYQNDIDAVSYMIYAIKNKLADTLKEALHLYIEQKHRREMEATMHGMARSIEIHNREMESYMSDISTQQRIVNSRLASIEVLTFLDYIGK